MGIALQLGAGPGVLRARCCCVGAVAAMELTGRACGAGTGAAAGARIRRGTPAAPAGWARLQG